MSVLHWVWVSLEVAWYTRIARWLNVSLGLAQGSTLVSDINVSEAHHSQRKTFAGTNVQAGTHRMLLSTCLQLGSWPSVRHEMVQWMGTDVAREARGRKHEKPGCHALLVQVRGEWSWCKRLFGFKFVMSFRRKSSCHTLRLAFFALGTLCHVIAQTVVEKE